jgi:competence protein ComEA
MKNVVRYRLNHYFNFTKKYRRGTLLLLAIIVAFVILPFFYPFLFPPRVVNSTAFAEQIKQLKINDSSDNKKKQPKFADESETYPGEQPKKAFASNEDEKPLTHTSLFVFDPNTLSEKGWQQLGLSAKAAASIRKYIDKGGKFRQPEDIKKIWALRPADIERLLPYVKIASNSPVTETPATAISYTAPAPKQYVKTIVDINTADTTAFIALPGIGGGYAKRIIAFREKLGGFYNISQVAETYGLPDSTFKKIQPQLSIAPNFVLKKINLNTATLDVLKAHPYIRYQMANAIVQYRHQHGNFTQLDQLKNINLITEDAYEKIKHYLLL